MQGVLGTRISGYFFTIEEVTNQSEMIVLQEISESEALT